MATTDLTQPINRKEAVSIIDQIDRARGLVRAAIRRSQDNGHDDCPDYLDDALSLMSSAVESINDELDSARSEAAA